jgi:hypothetical protein
MCHDLHSTLLQKPEICEVISVAKGSFAVQWFLSRCYTQSAGLTGQARAANND